ncbi:MAG: RnfABCDGE type electron transport complex subunit G [Desulfovibrio sp.]
MREIIKMIVVLSLICGLSGLSLASIKQFTAPLIEEQVLTFVQGPSIKAVFGEYDNDPVKERKQFDLPDSDGKVTVFPARKGGKLMGVAFETKGQGYGGELGVMIGFTFEPGAVAGIGMTTLKETPGIGARVAKHGFTGQFRGHGLENLALRSQGGDIDAVSGATISSTAAMFAVNQALGIYSALKDQFVTAFSTGAQ